jgi:hypothetical protein
LMPVTIDHPLLLPLAGAVIGFYFGYILRG